MQCTFRSVEIHPQWRYKICICLVILGELDSKLQGLESYFPETDVLRKISEIFSFLSPSPFFNPKILGFLFSTKSSLT